MAKKILLAGSALAASRPANRYNKVVGRTIFAAGIWEAGSIVNDLIGKKGKKIRLSGIPIRSSTGEITDILVENELDTPSLLRMERFQINSRKEKLRLMAAELLARAGLYR